MSGAGAAERPRAGAEAASDPELRLERAGARLAALCGREPLALERGGARALEDRLWVWGVLGGKDVGKSTLVRALAGLPESAPPERVGEGTRHPRVLFAAADREAVERRFEGLPGGALELEPGAPAARRGLALVDLPDIDSVYEDHAEQVRAIATRLDGILWLATPKKLGDRRGLLEVRRLLKDRANIVPVVNKLDWLLAQADGPPEKELARLDAALEAQSAGSEPGEGGAAGAALASPGGFLISALHPTEAALFAAIAAQQGLRDAQPLRADPERAAAVARVAGDFERLRILLTTPPSAEAAEAGKRANLAFQLRGQARALRAAFQPERLLVRLERATSPDELAELWPGFLPQAWVEAVLRRLQPRERLLSEWSARLFATRLAGWPLLGLVAWPAVLLASAIGSAGAWLRREGPRGAEAAFDAHGVSLAERLAGLRAAFANRLSGRPALVIELPSAELLAQRFRSRALALADEQRAAALEPLLRERAGPVRRALRGALALGILLWFPLLQPLLAGALEVLRAGTGGEASAIDVALALASALSGRAVLAGLVASLLLLGLLAAGVYARAVRRALALLERLEGELVAAGARELVGGTAQALAAPALEVQAELAELAGELERLAEPGAAAG